MVPKKFLQNLIEVKNYLRQFAIIFFWIFLKPLFLGILSRGCLCKRHQSIEISETVTETFFVKRIFLEFSESFREDIWPPENYNEIVLNKLKELLAKGLEKQNCFRTAVTFQMVLFLTIVNDCQSLIISNRNIAKTNKIKFTVHSSQSQFFRKCCICYAILHMLWS